MKLSLSTWCLEYRFGYERALRMIKEAGFDALDYNLVDWCGTKEEILAAPAVNMTRDEMKEHFAKKYEIAKEIGLEFGQTHSIFGGPAFFNHRELFERVTRDNIYQTHLLHCHHTVIHPIATNTRKYDADFEACHQMNLEFFRSLIPDLEKYDVKIAIEPMWHCNDEGHICPTVCSHPEEILQFIDELGSEHFCSCPDLGHFALTGEDTGDTVGGALRKLGKTVEIIHAHEVEKDHDRHTKPFSYGSMDWADIGAALREIGYEGNLNFEVGGYYFDKYPDALVPEALRHLAVIGKWIANA